jgi:hypothetical protein
MEDDEGWDDGGRESGADAIVSRAIVGADSGGGTADAAGKGAPHSGQNFPEIAISRLQEGQVGIGQEE